MMVCRFLWESSGLALWCVRRITDEAKKVTYAAQVTERREAI